MPSKSQSDTERECSRYRSQLTTSKVTGAPSGKTSYVIIGDNAGPSKLAKIKDLRIKTLDEDGFLDLIRNRDEEPDEATLKKREKEEKKIKEAAAEMEKQEREEERLRKRKEAALAKSGVATKYVSPSNIADLREKRSLRLHSSGLRSTPPRTSRRSAETRGRSRSWASGLPTGMSLCNTKLIRQAKELQVRVQEAWQGRLWVISSGPHLRPSWYRQDDLCAHQGSGVGILSSRAERE